MAPDLLVRQLELLILKMGKEVEAAHSHIPARQCVAVAVCCSVLPCVAVCCSVLQCVAVCCSALQCVTVCCSVLQCVAVCSALP